MNIQQLFEQLNEKLFQTWTDNHSKTKEEVSHILQTLLNKSADSLNLVTREEFQEAQNALAKAQQRIIQLEDKLTELEKAQSKASEE